MAKMESASRVIAELTSDTISSALAAFYFGHNKATPKCSVAGVIVRVFGGWHAVTCELVVQTWKAETNLEVQCQDF